MTTLFNTIVSNTLDIKLSITIVIKAIFTFTHCMSVNNMIHYVRLLLPNVYQLIKS